MVGRRAAEDQNIDYLKENRYHRSLNQDSVEQALARLTRWDQKGDGESVDALRAELRKSMEDHCGVFRTEDERQVLGADAASAFDAPHPMLRRYSTALISYQGLGNACGLSLRRAGSLCKAGSLALCAAATPN